MLLEQSLSAYDFGFFLLLKIQLQIIDVKFSDIWAAVLLHESLMDCLQAVHMNINGTRFVIRIQSVGILRLNIAEI